jgi:hypothetical protein
MEEVVTDAEPIMRGEIWLMKVASRRSGTVRSFYALEATGEVIGHPPAPSKPDRAALSSSARDEVLEAPVRADWATYIRGALGSGDEKSTLLDRLAWAHSGEYEKGISRLWRRRVEEDGEPGRAKMQVAERYVLANVIGSG